MSYLGEWSGKSVYQPEYNPATWEATRFPPCLVYKCKECKIRWFRAITNWYDGMCYYCWKEEYNA